MEREFLYAVLRWIRKNAQTRTSTGRSEASARGCVNVAKGRNAATRHQDTVSTGDTHSLTHSLTHALTHSLTHPTHQQSTVRERGEGHDARR